MCTVTDNKDYETELHAGNPKQTINVILAAKNTLLPCRTEDKNLDDYHFIAGNLSDINIFNKVHITSL